MDKAITSKVDVETELPEYGGQGLDSMSGSLLHDSTHRKLKPRHIQLVSPH